MRVCEVDGCERKHHARGLCITHWTRVHGRGHLPVDAPLQRGTAHLAAPTGTVRKVGKYLRVKTAAGWIEQHREVYRQHHGAPAEAVLCEWCGERQAADVHHLDHDTTNNEISNLAALCKTCHSNHHRGWEVRWGANLDSAKTSA